MGFKGKVYIADGTGDGNVPAVTLAQANTLFSRIVNYYVDTAERDAAAAGMNSTEKFGTVCWVGSVKSYFYWDGDSWESLATTKAFTTTRTAIAETASVTPAEILSNTVALPPGNRLVEINASCNVLAVATGAGWKPSAYVTGQNLAFGLMGQRTLASGETDTLSRAPWWLTCSGTVTFKVFMLNTAGTGVCRFSDVFLNVIDHGPA